MICSALLTLDNTNGWLCFCQDVFSVSFRGETEGRFDPTVSELNDSIPLGKQKCDRGDEIVSQMDRAIFTVHSIYMIAGFSIKQPCERLVQISTATASLALRCGFTP